ncbi:MAG: hypothetical protein OXH16_01975, partial [Gemmatimonadetes bacterium]|nr:hypothetical protein [Gemmatimonadota bacterium]
NNVRTKNEKSQKIGGNFRFQVSGLVGLLWIFLGGLFWSFHPIRGVVILRIFSSNCEEPCQQTDYR